MSKDNEQPHKNNKRTGEGRDYVANSITPIGIKEYEGGIGRSFDEHLRVLNRPPEYFAGSIDILDGGPGPTGRFARGLHAINPEARITSLSPDFSDPVHWQKFAESGALETGAAFPGLVQKMPFGDKQFDRVVFLYVFSYLSVGQMVDGIREIGRVLKPGGEGVIAPVWVLKEPKDGKDTKFAPLLEVIADLKAHDDGAFPEVEIEDAPGLDPDGQGDAAIRNVRLVIRPRADKEKA